MDTATLPTDDLATHVKIVAIGVAAALVAGLIGMGAQTRPRGSKPLLQTAGHIVAPRN